MDSVIPGTLRRQQGNLLTPVTMDYSSRSIQVLTKGNIMYKAGDN